MIGSYDRITTITDTYAMLPTDDVVVAVSGFGGGKTVTLPKAGLCTHQLGNNSKRLVNLAGSGGTATIAAASGDTLNGRSSVVVAAGAILESNGANDWYAF